LHFWVGSSLLQNTHILFFFLLPVVWVDSISIGENSGLFYFYNYICNCMQLYFFYYDIGHSWGQIMRISLFLIIL
jgi:hypothetical protein